MSTAVISSRAERLYESVAREERPVLEEALRDSINWASGRPELPETITVPRGDFAVTSVTVGLQFTRFTATCRLKLIDVEDNGDLVYSVEGAR